MVDAEPINFMFRFGSTQQVHRTSTTGLSFTNTSKVLLCCWRAVWKSQSGKNWYVTLHTHTQTYTHTKRLAFATNGSLSHGVCWSVGHLVGRSVKPFHMWEYQRASMHRVGNINTWCPYSQNLIDWIIFNDNYQETVCVDVSISLQFYCFSKFGYLVQLFICLYSMLFKLSTRSLSEWRWSDACFMAMRCFFRWQSIARPS